LGSGGSNATGGAASGSGGATSSSGSGGSGGSTTTVATGGSAAGGSPGTGGTVAATGGKAAGGSGGGAGGTAGSAGGPGSGGSPGGSGGGTNAGGTTTNTGGGSATGDGGAGGGAGGSKAGGSSGGGGAAGGSGGGGGATGTGGGTDNAYTCNTVLGIDSTSEWYTGGFEKQVTDSKWQLIYYHPGYVEDWAKSSDAVWSQAPTSPCTTSSTNPDRVIFNVFGDTSDTAFTTSAAWVTGLSSAIDNMKKKWSNLKRVDLLTMPRGPNDQKCFSSDNTVVASYVDDAIAKVVTAYPGLVTASPKFYVTNCSDFDSSNPPHLSTAGKTNMAKVFGDYYSANP
jgi:hypothetical protein